MTHSTQQWSPMMRISIRLFSRPPTNNLVSLLPIMPLGTNKIRDGIPEIPEVPISDWLTASVTSQKCCSQLTVIQKNVCHSSVLVPPTPEKSRSQVRLGVGLWFKSHPRFNHKNSLLHLLPIHIHDQ